MVLPALAMSRQELAGFLEAQPRHTACVGGTVGTVSVVGMLVVGVVGTTTVAPLVGASMSGIVSYPGGHPAYCQLPA